jgi:hypothetical protein
VSTAHEIIHHVRSEKSLLESALAYASRGLAVFPLAPGTKVPMAGSRGYHDATTDPDQIRRWWTDTPDANIGIALGERSGVWVLDIDRKNGKDGFAHLDRYEAEHGQLPPTRVGGTPNGGGGHYYFLCTAASKALRNRAYTVDGKESGIDVKTTGGYVVAPPSSIPEGQYVLLTDHAIAEAPESLIDYLIAGQSGNPPPTSPPPPPRPRSTHAPAHESRTPEDVLHNVLSRLDRVAKSREGQYTARCPAHDDRSPSLSVGVGDDGRILLTCHAKCKTGAIISAIGLTMADLYVGGRRGHNTERNGTSPPPPPSDSSGAATATEAPPATPTQKPPTAKVLVEIARTEAELWHNDRQRGYATIGRRSLPIRTTQFRQWLTSRYRKVSGGHVANSDAIANALTAIEAEAVCDGPTYDAYTRVARHNGRIYLHLADEPDTVIEIGPGYWRECDSPPVRFRRSPNAKPLPMPKRGGSLDPLRRLLNIESDSQFALVVGWLCGALRGAGPYPTLVITGNHGSGKSTAENTIKRLIDPTAGGLRSQPREERDLMVAANNSHVLAFDNFSTLPDWLSDSFCRLATGGGLSTRGLYTDDDEIVFEAVKPTILNGISDFVARPDLLDRAILLHLPTIPDDRRRTEDAYWADFDSAHPMLLGAILDRLANGLAHLDTTDLAALPRMADFARFAVACESNSDSGQFLRAFGENENAANEQAIENSSLALAIVDLLATRDSWEGTPTDLLAALAGRARLAATARDWPKTASVLSGKLTRLAPSLRKSRHIEISKGHCGTGGKRSRTVRLSRIRDGDWDGVGRRWDGDRAQTPSQSFGLKTSQIDIDGTDWDGWDGVSHTSTGTPPRLTTKGGVA